MTGTNEETAGPTRAASGALSAASQERWPEALRAACGVVLAGDAPMALLWGEALAVIANDALAALFPGELRPGIPLSPQAAPWLDSAAAKAVLAGEPARQTIVAPTSRDEHYRFSARYRPVHDGRGEGSAPAGVLVSFVREPAEGERAEPDVSSSRFLLALSDTTPDLFFAKGRDGRMLWANPAMLRVAGKSAADVVGVERVLDLDNEQDAIIRSNDLYVMASGRTQSFEEMLPGPRGPRLYQVTKWPLRDDASGKIEGVMGLAHDVTEQRRSEEALRASQTRYRALFENMGEGFLLADVVCDGAGRTVDLRFLDVNPAFEALTGLKRAAVLGRTGRELLEEIDERWLAVVGAVALGGEPRRAQMRWPTSERRFEALVFSPRRGQFACLFTDVTMRLRAEASLRESEAQFHQLAEAMPQIVWIAAPDGALEYCNGRWEQYAGTSRESLRADGWAHLVHPADASATLARWQRSVATGEPFEAEYRLRRADGQYRWFLARGLAVRDSQDQVVRWLGTSTDIDEQKRAQAALQESDQRKNDFLAMLSHELRNPLAPLRNGAHILRRAAPGSDAARRATEIIERQTAHLARMVEDLLDVTRIVRRKMSLQRERFDLADLACAAAADVEAVFEANGIALEVCVSRDAPVFMTGDPTRIGQVIGNLLHNAAKFTARGGRARLSLHVEGGEAARIEVADDGVGLEPELMARIFEPFVQDDRTLDRRKGGLGLGLSVVKGIVELHGGEVAVRSDGPGTGARFIVRLPIER